jgi:septum formation protein
MIVLASASPRRRELLDAAGIAFVVRPANIDESRRPGEPPRAYALRMAREKAVAVEPIVDGRPCPVLGADTVVAVDAHVVDKPGSAERATAALRSLSGRDHRVITAVAVRHGRRLLRRAVVTIVSFRTLSDEEIANYVATKEPLDRAGAYAIQGGGAALVHRVTGSYTAVVGLPVAETLALLAQVGVHPG